LVGIPQRKIPVLDAFDPEESRGDEIGAEVSFREEVSSIKQVIEKEEGTKKKGQTSQKIGRLNPFYFRPYGGCHKRLILCFTMLLLQQILSHKWLGLAVWESA